MNIDRSFYGYAYKEEIKIIFLLICFILIVCIYLFTRLRTSGFTFEEKTIHLTHLDLTLEKIQFIWITNIGDLSLKKEDIEKICTNNTIIILSGYSKKRTKRYQEEKLKFLSTLAPVYYVWSTQDYNGEFRDLNALLLDCKVTILENTSVLFETENGTKFSIVGFDDPETNREHLFYALENVNPEEITILTSYSEVLNSSENDYKSIEVYLFERSQTNVLRNQKTIYLELNNDKGLLKRKTISVVKFKIS